MTDNVNSPSDLSASLSRLASGQFDANTMNFGNMQTSLDEVRAHVFTLVVDMTQPVIAAVRRGADVFVEQQRR